MTKGRTNEESVVLPTSTAQRRLSKSSPTNRSAKKNGVSDTAQISEDFCRIFSAFNVQTHFQSGKLQILTRSYQYTFSNQETYFARMSQDHTDPFMDQGPAGPAGPASPHQHRVEELLARMTHTIREVDTTLPPEERQQFAANLRQGLDT
ncbi:hypothetical protein LTS15_000849 [Exophiala xenobiotica]|nr:hypothetical protein LTS15_000849 [Exophiala xenobiotica]